MVGANLTGPIDKIHEQPIFSNIWHLQHQFVDSLQKLGTVQFLLDVHTFYIIYKDVFALFSRKKWRDPEEVGKYYKIPPTKMI